VFDLTEDRDVLGDGVVGLLAFIVQVRTLGVHGPIYGGEGDRDCQTRGVISCKAIARGPAVPFSKKGCRRRYPDLG
jgi:hypothetical protein